MTSIASGVLSAASMFTGACFKDGSSTDKRKIGIPIPTPIVPGFSTIGRISAHPVPRSPFPVPLISHRPQLHMKMLNMTT